MYLRTCSLFILRSHHYTLVSVHLVCLFLWCPPLCSRTHTCANVQGTLFNALAVGACVYGVGAAGILQADWMPAAALLFGVITSAVDPVAVSDVMCSRVCAQCTYIHTVCTSDHIQCMQWADCSTLMYDVMPRVPLPLLPLLSVVMYVHTSSTTLPWI